MNDLLSRLEELTQRLSRELVECRPDEVGSLLCEHVHLVDQIQRTPRAGLDRARLERVFRSNRALLQTLHPYLPAPRYGRR